MVITEIQDPRAISLFLLGINGINIYIRDIYIYITIEINGFTYIP